ncbi:H/ACA ribonucleoprotein complex non-core subunit NAF1 [Temnothorax longispinosus]|uniref:H/ACA ribonucleoprotein complex non-core subunit NAF1 n=1 Tax=Temnothorax longispinosus TaxID=300112 RepID=A0A4S2KSS0_9HYME|nr:H/ACA ribonucleoprotein complex non-core subunit NAF1 [Temnothorax longispinosus]
MSRVDQAWDKIKVIDIDANKVVHEEMSMNMSTSEENKNILQEKIELLTSHQLMCGEGSLKEECEAKQLDEQSSEEKHEAMFCDEKLENERAVIIVNEKEILNRENKCDKPNVSIMLDTEETESTINSCVISTDIPNISIQSTSEENDETNARKYHTTAENIPDIRQALQKSLEIIECNMSNDTNIVQSKYLNKVIDQVAEVSIRNNEIQISNLSPQKQEDRTSSLSVIAAEYGDTSDSDVEKIEADTTTKNQYTMPEIQTQHLQKRGSKANTAKKEKHTENELDDLPPIEDLQISVPEVLCNPFGKQYGNFQISISTFQIEKIVEQLVIVEPKPGEPTLDLDTILFVNKGTKALGKIFDVYGPVAEPHYCVRFNDSKHIQDNGIKVGMQVYYCPSNKSYTFFVFLQELRKLKACDTAGDDESPEFSDDEEEQAYYEKLKQKNNKDCSDGKTSQKKPRQTESSYTTPAWQSNHPWNRNRNVRPQRYNQRRQRNWSGGNRFNSAQTPGPYPYQESWQQYPYQNNVPWQPVPQNMHPMSNRSYAGYGTYNAPHLAQDGNLSNTDGTNQYYQGTYQNFQSYNIQNNFQSNGVQDQYYEVSFGAPPRFNLASPPVEMNCHQFSNTPYPYMNMPSYPTHVQSSLQMANANACWPPPAPPSLDTPSTTIEDPNSST